nr:SpaA isopeptide-forming pilin-related protein [Leucobacter exalbidus]
MKGDLRTSLDSGGINVASTYTEGAQFALYTSETSTDAVDTCTITVPADGCRFGAVTQTGKLWVGEIDPVPGSPAALHYSAPLGSLATGTLGAYTERSYRYATPVITSTTTGTITLPEASGRNTGGGWAASSQRYANRLLNPNLELDCAVGINVALVMDLSGSVAQAGAADTLRDAALGFVDALEGSGSSVALISFGNASPRAGTTNQTIPLQVDDAAQRAVINDTIQQYRDHTVRDQGTNWDAGMWEASQEAASYDIVFVLTDGNPTFSGTSPDGSGSLTTFAELERAVFSANAIKEAGARVITVGIGDGLSDSNLAAVSGPVPFTSGETLDQFDFINTDWQALQTVLKNFGAHLGCSADVTVTKLAGENSATPAPAAGWTFTAAAEGATLSPAAAQETNEAGQASWRVALPGVNAEAAVTLTETQRADAGWELTDLACTVNGTPLPLDVGLSATVSGVVAGDDVQCTYTNVKRNATLTLVKEVNNQYGGTGTPGDWQLTAAGDTKTLTGATGEDAVTAVQVPLGEYALSEADGPAGYDPSAWACVDAGSDPAQTLTTTGGTVTLPAGGQVTCTITNSDLPGAVTWSKTAAIGGDLLAGSEWKIDGSTAISTLTDCDEAPCPAGGDQDPAAGAFSLTGLAWGEYEVTETKAPPGYVGGASFTFTVSGDTAGSVIAIGDVTNDQQAGVALPLTGGVSREMITLGGAAVALLALIAGALYTVRRRARAEAV